MVQPTTSVMKATNWTARTTYLETIIDISQHLSESLEFSPLLYERDDTKETAPLYVPLKETQDELQSPTRRVLSAQFLPLMQNVPGHLSQRFRYKALSMEIICGSKYLHNGSSKLLEMGVFNTLKFGK